MNPIRSWLEKRDARRKTDLARRQAEMDDLGTRLGALIAGFRDRLSPKSHAFIAEQPEYGEPEAAIEMLWENIDSGDLVPSSAERSELLALTTHPAADPGELPLGRKHLISSDIERR